MKANEPAVRGEANVDLDAVDRARERPRKGRNRTVRAVGPSQPVRDQGRQVDVENRSTSTAGRCESPANRVFSFGERSST